MTPTPREQPWSDERPEHGRVLVLSANPISAAIDHDAPDAARFLRDALASPASYVAMMASPRRAERMLAELADAPGIEKLHVPAGHNLGGKAPGEIALSVVAEIVAESYERPGGPMRG